MASAQSGAAAMPNQAQFEAIQPGEAGATLEPHLDSGAKDAQNAILSDPQPIHAIDAEHADQGGLDHDHAQHDDDHQTAASSSSRADHVNIPIDATSRRPTSASSSPVSDKERVASDGSSRSSSPARGSNEKQSDSAKNKRTKKKKGDDEAVDRVGFKQLYRYATVWDHLFNFVGLIAAAAAGAVQPLMTIVFGSLTTAFLEYSNALLFGGDIPAARDHLNSEIVHGVLFLVYIGVAMLVATYVYMAAWIYTGQVVTRRIREHYLQAILRQDIAYFDVVGAGEITTRIQSDIQLIQEGISDKIPMSVMFISAFVTGFIVAYVKSWQLALALSSMIPCIIIAGALMNAVTAKLQQAELDRVSKAASIAEESLATLRTAKAFGIEHNLVQLYDESNRQATRFGIKRSLYQGIGMGLVDAQKIRAKVATEKLDGEDSDSDDNHAPLTAEANAAPAPLATTDAEKARLRDEAKAEMPAGLDKSVTRGSVASAILQQRQRQAEADKESEKIPSIFYLLYRLAKINRDHIMTLTSRCAVPLAAGRVRSRRAASCCTTPTSGRCSSL
ncbi:hypothetical protein L1887_57274 [Cichorium endivia]|nr:hypothetical protein L1887_57274 [Cichorium endivia]